MRMKDWTHLKRELLTDPQVAKAYSEAGAMKTVTATEARRRLIQILEEVEQGASYLVTRYGRPVMRMLPPGTDPDLVDQTQQEEYREFLNRYGDVLDQLAKR